MVTAAGATSIINPHKLNIPTLLIESAVENVTKAGNMELYKKI